VSSNDSVVRLYRMDDKALEHEFMGHCNTRSHFQASCSPNRAYVLSASEGRDVIVWEVAPEEDADRGNKLSVSAYEHFVASDAPITQALFVPTTQSARFEEASSSSSATSPAAGLTIVVATVDGTIHVYHNVNLLATESLARET